MITKLGMRKSFIVGAFLGLAGLASAVVIQGELTPGIYNNYVIDAFGRMPVVLAPGAAPMDVAVTSMPSSPMNVSGTVTATPVVYSYRNFATNGTVVAKTGAGTLKRIVVNTAGVTSNITVYDSVTGTGTKIGTATSLLAQSSIDYDVEFSNGLTVVAAGLTPADITVVYR